MPSLPQCKQVGQGALSSGALASILSTLAITWRSRRDSGAAAAGTNATSHWLWGNAALAARRPSLRHTLVGYAIHHACSIFWAGFYEHWRRRHLASMPAQVAGAVVLAGVAYVVDYTITPQRLRPGFEHHLRPGSMLLVYAAFAAGLALAARAKQP